MRRVIRLLSAFLSLTAFWLLLSGMFVPFLVAAGFGSALFVTLLCRRMDVVDHEGHPYRLAWPAALTYWPWLLKEIVVSAWTVTRLVLQPRPSISPVLVAFRPSQRTDVGLTIHANSITLTPGTLAVEVERDRFLVHALTRAGGDSLAGSEMDARCTALEGRG